MSMRVFLGLLVITVMTAVAAAIVAFERPVAAPVRYLDEPAFPALRESPDAVAKVALTTPDGSFTLVRETGDRWSALERFGYTVDAGKVRELIVALTDMRLVEAKTSLPERYPRLEVEDPAAEGAKSRLLRVEGADGTVLAEAIFGKRQHRLTGGQPAGTYLRRPGEQQSWLASGGVAIDPAVVDWLDAEIVDLDPARIARIEVRPDAGEGYVLRRDGVGQPLQLADLAAGESAKQDADGGRVAGAFAGMRLEEVRPRAEVDWPEAHHRAVATSFDGIEVTVQLAELDGEPWALLDARPVEPLAPPPTAAADPSEADEATQAADGAGAAGVAEPEGVAEGGAAESPGEELEPVEIAAGEDAPLDAGELAARLGPWAFKLPSQVFERLTRPRSEWLADSGTS